MWIFRCIFIKCTVQNNIIIFIIVFGVNFIINNFLLEKYYINKKEEQLIEIYNYANSDLEEKDLEKLYHDCSINNISIITINKILNNDIYIEKIDKPNNPDKHLENKIIDYINANKEINGYKIIITNDKYTNLNYIEMYGILDSGNYVLIRTPLDSISESISILNSFTIFGFLICLLVSCILITIFAEYLSAPIKKLCALSEKMINLDFSEKYNKSTNAEIDILSKNFNKLSDSLDLTMNELRTANEKLEKDLKEKIKIDDMRKEFITNISHELKTPLALIQGYSEGLKENINDDEESRNFYCDVIIDESKKMNNLVLQLINLNQFNYIC